MTYTQKIFHYHFASYYAKVMHFSSAFHLIMVIILQKILDSFKVKREDLILTRVVKRKKNISMYIYNLVNY